MKNSLKYIAYLTLIATSCLFATGVHAARSDFNNDNVSDFLMRHEGFPGTWYIAYMRGPRNMTSMKVVTDLPAGDGFYAAATNDFDGDGIADVLIRDQLGIWYMYLISAPSNSSNIVRIKASATMPMIALPSYEILYRGDFDEDGKTDLIVNNAFTGDTIVYYMNGTRVKRQQSLNGLPASSFFSSWKKEIAGDFDGDNRIEVLYRKLDWSTFSQVWYMFDINSSETSATSRRASELDFVDFSWATKTAKDYNQDGIDELILQNNLTLAWQTVRLNGTQVISSNSFPLQTFGYVPAGGTSTYGMDTDGDGRLEIIQRQASFNTYYRTEIQANGSIYTTPAVDLPAIPFARIVVTQ